jgi:hypothetical protein
MEFGLYKAFVALSPETGKELCVYPAWKQDRAEGMGWGWRQAAWVAEGDTPAKAQTVPIRFTSTPTTWRGSRMFVEIKGMGGVQGFGGTAGTGWTASASLNCRIADRPHPTLEHAGAGCATGTR